MIFLLSSQGIPLAETLRYSSGEDTAVWYMLFNGQATNKDRYILKVQFCLPSV